MRHVFVRPAESKDSPEFVKFSLATKDNLFDPDVAKYKSTIVLCAYNSEGPMVFMPIQQAFVMDALAIKPELGAIDTAVALKELTQAAVTQAHIKGVGEIYFMCKDESTIEFAKRQAFEEMPWKVMRLKLKDLETKNETNS